MEFHQKLQELRRTRGVTQEELAQSLYVSRTAISKWESGRGYPNLESLKAIAEYFSVTVDQLLSSEELLPVAAEMQEDKKTRLRDLTLGLPDCGTGLLLFLPFFRQTAEEGVRAISLVALAGTGRFLPVLYLFFVIATGLWGIAMLALQGCDKAPWVRGKYKTSCALSGICVLLFIAGLQPYAAVFVFLLLCVKAFLLIRQP